MSKTLTIGLVVILVAAGLFGGGWMLRSQHDAQVIVEASRLAAEKSAADSVRWIVVVDSLRQLDSLQVEKARLDSIETSRLRRQAANHAASDAALDSALAEAKTDAERVPILTVQRDEARLAYVTLRLEDSVGRAQAAEVLKTRLGFAEQRRVADSTMYASRIKSLAAVNADLALEIDRLKGKDKLFGFIPKPSRELSFILGAGSMVCVLKC